MTTPPDSNPDAHGRAAAAPETFRFAAAPHEAGPRLDVWLARRLPALSRARLQALIRAGSVTVNGAAVKEHRPVRAGDNIALVVPAPAPVALRPEAIPLAILHEDADLIVLDKPAGLVVHPAAGHATGTLVHALLHHAGPEFAIGGDQRPGIVHRLDRDTSGVMVVAKTAAAQAALVAQFQRRRVSKTYVALVWGVPDPARGTIATLIGRHTRDRKKMSAVPNTGRPAVTHYAVVESFGPAALVRLKPETGRTHQLRVHLAHRGHPVVGDTVYGRRATAGLPAPAPRQMLHAETLAFDHPATGRRLEFTAPWPADFRDLAGALRRARSDRAGD